MGQSLPLFVYFPPFLITISTIQIEKSIDGMLGIQTWGRRMVGADETPELRWLPIALICWHLFGQKSFIVLVPVRRRGHQDREQEHRQRDREDAPCLRLRPRSSVLRSAECRG